MELKDEFRFSEQVPQKSDVKACVLFYFGLNWVFNQFSSKDKNSGSGHYALAVSDDGNISWSALQDFGYIHKRLSR